MSGGTALRHPAQVAFEIVDELADELVLAAGDPSRRRAAQTEAKRRLHALLHGEDLGVPATPSDRGPSEIFKNCYAHTLSSPRAPEQPVDFEPPSLLWDEIFGYLAADLDDES